MMNDDRLRAVFPPPAGYAKCPTPGCPRWMGPDRLHCWTEVGMSASSVLTPDWTSPIIPIQALLTDLSRTVCRCAGPNADPCVACRATALLFTGAIHHVRSGGRRDDQEGSPLMTKRHVDVSSEITREVDAALRPFPPASAEMEPGSKRLVFSGGGDWPDASADLIWRDVLEAYKPFLSSGVTELVFPVDSFLCLLRPMSMLSDISIQHFIQNTLDVKCVVARPA